MTVLINTWTRFSLRCGNKHTVMKKYAKGSTEESRLVKHKAKQVLVQEYLTVALKLIWRECPNLCNPIMTGILHNFIPCAHMEMQIHTRVIQYTPYLLMGASVPGDVHQINVRWSSRYHWNHRECEFLKTPANSVTPINLLNVHVCHDTDLIFAVSSRPM